MQRVANFKAGPESSDDPLMTIRTIRGVISLRESEIVFVKSAGNYVEICAGEKVHVARGTLANFANSIQTPNFIQSHRSYLLNSNFVAELRECGRGLAEIHLSNGSVLPVSRKRKRHITNLLSGIVKPSKFIQRTNTVQRTAVGVGVSES